MRWNQSLSFSLSLSPHSSPPTQSDFYSLTKGVLTPNPELPGSLPTITLGPEFTFVQDFLARFPHGIPSMRAIQDLTIAGDVMFDADVVLKVSSHPPPFESFLSPSLSFPLVSHSWGVKGISLSLSCLCFTNSDHTWMKIPLASSLGIVWTHACECVFA